MVKDPVNYRLPGEFLEAIKTRPVSEVKEVFEALAQKKLAEITGCQNTEELIRVQAQARFCQELEQFFLAEMKR